MGSISIGGTTLSASASGFLFRSNLKGTIYLLTIGTREKESFSVAGGGRL